MASLQLPSLVFFLTSFGASPQPSAFAENVSFSKDVFSVTYRLPPTRVSYMHAPPAQEEAAS